ncbi:MAG: flippase, partial [Patescibacteria group bacterium]
MDNQPQIENRNDRSSLGRRVKGFLLTNQTTGQTVAKNTFWLAVSNLGGRLIKAGIIIYSARLLGAAEWGLFSYAVSFAAFITIFTDFGVGPILTRETSKTDDPKKKSEIISTAFFLKLALLLVGILIVIFVAPSLSTMKEASFLFPIISLIIIFDTLQGFGFSLTRAMERMELEAGFYLLTNASIVVFGFLALHFYPKVEYFSYAYAAGIAVGTAATLFSLRNNFKNLFLNFKRKLIAPIMGAAWPFVISGVLGSLMINTDILLIGYFLSAKDVGIYSAADRPIQLLYVLPGILATSVFPTLARLANKNKERFRMILEKTLSLAYLISIPLVLGGIVLGGDIIRGVFGQPYTGAVLSFRILLATLSINFAAVIFSNAIFAHDRQKDLIKFAALGGISNLVFDLI